MTSKSIIEQIEAVMEDLILVQLKLQQLRMKQDNHPMIDEYEAQVEMYKKQINDLISEESSK